MNDDSSPLKLLFQRVLEWYSKKSPLPPIIEPKIFSDKVSFLKFIGADENPLAPEYDACCVTMPNPPKIYVALQLSMVNWSFFSQVCVILHELEHCRELTEGATFPLLLIQSEERRKETEVRVSCKAFLLAQEYTGQKMPGVINEYVKRRFEREL